ncbi:hypothetical protein SLEP1_g10103 [Rubroshorea leprosula]|uniref:Enoyl-CoA hydratase n=1 Tax=Rubroshorea leprosula TaxID=152421 RepID=A0AAV5I722_9ROSI|nr:hypothetical protein SLEP1_g10103 [Rubroshorea leprosula]
MMKNLAQGFKALGKDNSIRVIILTRSGRAFCSSVDLTAAEDVFKGDVKDLESNTVAQMERCPKPIIGAINGFAVTARSQAMFSKPDRSLNRFQVWFPV